MQVQVKQSTVVHQLHAEPSSDGGLSVDQFDRRCALSNTCRQQRKCVRKQEVCVTRLMSLLIQQTR